MSPFASIWRGFTALAATLILVFLPGGPALATDPLTISDTLTDPSSFFSSNDKQQILHAAQRAQATGLDIYVVAVPDFSGMESVRWCQEAGSTSGLSKQSIVYVLAYEERAHASCGNADEQVVTDSELTTAMSAAKSLLAKAHPLDSATASQAAIAFIASATQDARSGSLGNTGSNDTGSDSSVIDSPLPYLVLIGVIVIIGAMIFSERNKKRRAHVSAEVSRGHATSARERIQHAQSLLLHADEFIRSARDELDFARAQFGAEKTDAYADTYATAARVVKECFEIHAQINAAPHLEDAAILADTIISRLNAVMAELAQRQEEFTALRNREANVGAQLSDVVERITQARENLKMMKAELASLSRLYPQTTIASLLDNPTQAQALLDSAEDAATRARSLVDTDPASALRALDTARRALAMAGHQIDSVFSAQDDLAHADSLLIEAIASITADIADVSRLNADPQAFAPLLADANAAVTSARTARSGASDPLAALEQLRLAELTLDAALAPLRSRSEAEEKSRESARRAISDAHHLLARAEGFVQSRRGMIGLDQRSTLAAAQSELAQAGDLVEQDPERARSLADSAASRAREVLSTPTTPDTIGPFGRNSTRGGSSMTGSALGDALLWSVLLGGNRTSSWESHSRHDHHSTFGGGFGGGFGSGGFGGGTFGGGRGGSF